MRSTLLILGMGLMLLGCAQEQPPQVRPKNIAEATPSRQEVCQNCMARFKASLGMEKLTTELLYKQCPVCRPQR